MAVNFGAFDPEELFSPHVQLPLHSSTKRSADNAGMDGHILMASHYGKKKDEKMTHVHGSKSCHQSKSILSNGKKTKGRVKIKMEFIDNKLRRYTTFSKRKTGIMKKAYELSTLTGTQVMLLVASETGHVYTFATRKLQPMITSDAGKALIQTCLNSPDPPTGAGPPVNHDQRMSATGYEETELTYAVPEDDQMKNSPVPEDFLNGNASCSGSDSSMPPSPSDTPEMPSISPLPSTSDGMPHSLAQQLPPGMIFKTTTPSETIPDRTQSTNQPVYLLTSSSYLPTSLYTSRGSLSSTIVSQPTVVNVNKGNHSSGGNVFVGGANRGMMYAPGSGVVYATPSSSDASSRLMVNLPSGLHHLASPDTDSRKTTDLLNFPMHLTTAALQKAAASASRSNSGMQALPTDLSMHIKRESRS